MAVCRDMASGCSLGDQAPERTTTTPQVVSGVSAPKGALGGRPERKCDLCAKLGMGGDTHSREWCYIDPKSRAYKPEVRQRRVAQAQARGLAIP